MKKIFNAVAPVGRVLFGNGRYIHYDGSAFGSKGVKRYVQQPEIQAGFYAAIAVGVTNLFLHDPNTATLSFLTNFAFLPVSCAIKFFYDSYLLKEIKKNTAIDTEGRDLSAQSVSINDLYNLEKNKKFAVIGIALYAALDTGSVLSGIYKANLTLASDVLLYSYFAKQFWNSSQLLSGDYKYCDKQPPEKKSANLLRFLPFGKTSPS
jgi:hypothetical protein